MSVPIKSITVEELNRLRQNGDDFTLLDVRELPEYSVCNLGGVLIPLGQLKDRFNELDKQKKLIVHCKAGGRSAQAVSFLQGEGFHNAYNLQGGILEWINTIDPSLQKY